MFLITLLRLLGPAADWTPALPELDCSNFLRFVRYSMTGPGSRGGLDACASRARPQQGGMLIIYNDNSALIRPLEELLR